MNYLIITLGEKLNYVLKKFNFLYKMDVNMLGDYNSVETENSDETENTPIQEDPSPALFYLLGNGSLLPYNILFNRFTQ